MFTLFWDWNSETSRDRVTLEPNAILMVIVRLVLILIAAIKNHDEIIFQCLHCDFQSLPKLLILIFYFL